MQIQFPPVPRSVTSGTKPSVTDVSDEALTAAGMVKVAAFIRGTQTSQAKRASKHRQKYTDAGLRQVNVIAPESAHSAIKAIAERVRTGCDVRTALEHVLTSQSQTTGSTKAEPMQFTKRRPSRSTNLRRLLTRLRDLGIAIRAAARRLLGQGEAQ